MRAGVVSVILGLVYGVLVAFWLGWPQEVEVVTIEAAQEVELAVPVYAQFVVTQTVVVPERVRLAVLELPLAVPEGGQSILVRVEQGSLVIEKWRYEPEESGVQMVRLELERPVRVQGELEVVIDGSHIAHGDQSKAPGVFIEPADYAYPDGNYRIADNVKEGDVAMRLLGKRSRLALVIEEWQQEPFRMAFTAGLVGCGLWLLLNLPGLLWTRQEK